VGEKKKASAVSERVVKSVHMPLGAYVSVLRAARKERKPFGAFMREAALEKAQRVNKAA
jgi:hypothetical protein